MPILTDLASRAGSAAQSLWEASGQLVQPSLRLGVTGLARSGKTVFTTALVHHLTRGTNLPAFRASAEGRIRRAHLAHQPDDDVPRFPLRGAHRGAHARAPLAAIHQPDQRVAGRCRIRAQSRLAHRARPRSPSISSIIRANGCSTWLFSTPATRTGRARPSRRAAGPDRAWRRRTLAREPRRPSIPPAPPTSAGRAGERSLQGLSRGAARRPEAVATTPPGRFLMPGDLAGSPALTFAPLDLPPGPADRAGQFRGADGAALRGLQDPCGAAVLPRPFPAHRPADRAGRRARRHRCRPRRAGRTGGGARPGADGLPHRAQHAPVPPVLAPRRPGAVRRHQGRPHPPYGP